MKVIALRAICRTCYYNHELCGGHDIKITANCKLKFKQHSIHYLHIKIKKLHIFNKNKHFFNKEFLGLHEIMICHVLCQGATLTSNSIPGNARIKQKQKNVGQPNHSTK